MTTLPDIQRLYTALAEVLAAVLYAQAVPPRMDKRLCWGITVVWAGLLAVFLQLTGDVPLVWWIPCMTAAIGWVWFQLSPTLMVIGAAPLPPPLLLPAVPRPQALSASARATALVDARAFFMVSSCVRSATSRHT